jgi:Flp pilus assembly protein TadG
MVPRLKPRQGGLATIEMAMVLPLLMLLTLGVIEYGWMFLKSQQITNAARQGARAGAPPDAGNAEVENTVDAIMSSSGMGSSGYSVDTDPAADGLASGTTFTVTVSVPYSNISLVGILPLLPSPTNLVAAVSMAKEGP